MTEVEVRDPRGEFVDALAQLLDEIETLIVQPESIDNERALGVIGQWRRLRLLLGMRAGYSKDEAKQEIEKFLNDFIASPKLDDTPMMLKKQCD